MNDIEHDKIVEDMMKKADAYHYIGSKDKMIVDLLHVIQVMDGIEEHAREIFQVDIPKDYEDFEKEIREIISKYRHMITREIGVRVSMIFEHGIENDICQ